MSQLRSFSAFNKTAAVSIVTRQCTLANIDGNYISGVANQYFQIHDKATAASAGNIPVRSYLLPSAGPVNLPSLFQTIGPIPLTNGLSIGISTTEATYTAATGTYDVFGEIEEYELPIVGLTAAASSPAAVTKYQFWNDASGPKKIYDLTITNGEGISVYPMLFARQQAGLALGQTPLLQLPIIADGATAIYNFGSGGLWPNQNVAGTLYQGCTVIMSSTAQTLTESIGAGSTISGHYK